MHGYRYNMALVLTDSDILSVVGETSRVPSGYWHNWFFELKKKILQPKRFNKLANSPLETMKEFFLPLCFVLTCITEIRKLGFNKLKSCGRWKKLIAFDENIPKYKYFVVAPI